MNYRLMWRDKRNPDSNGEGITVNNEARAYKICKKNNELFPNHEHWFEPVTPKPEDK